MTFFSSIPNLPTPGRIFAGKSSGLLAQEKQGQPFKYLLFKLNLDVSRI